LTCHPISTLRRASPLNEVNDVRPIDLEPVRNYWATIAAVGDTNQQMQCLVGGQMRPAVKRLPIPIRGIPGGKTTGMALISANEDAFYSYGLTASLIAPTCEACGERFGNALNALLRNQETHLTVASLAYIFWAKEQLPFSLTSLLSQPTTEDVRQVLQSAWKGRPETARTDLTPFYAACLTARGPRVVVRDWMETTLGSVQRHLARYFALQRIIDGQGNERWFALWQLVNATIRRDSKEEASPQVGQALLRLALSGGALPYFLLYQVIRRIRAEQEVQPVQAALIKMVLLSHKKHFNESEDTSMAELDPANDDLAYLCGRLLAVLEEVQQRALGDINAGVIEKYYGTASTAPASVFGRLLRGAQTHLTKMRGDKNKQGIAHRLDLQIQEILDEGSN
jgi:CRISPR-associated protein Csd1